MIKGDGSVIHFNNPKVQASLSANTFAVTGHAETKRTFHSISVSSLFGKSCVCMYDAYAGRMGEGCLLKKQWYLSHSLHFM